MSRIQPSSKIQIDTLRIAYIKLFDISRIDKLRLAMYEADYVMDVCREIVEKSEGVDPVHEKAMLVDIEHDCKDQGLKYLDKAKQYIKD